MADGVKGLEEERPEPIVKAANLLLEWLLRSRSGVEQTRVLVHGVSTEPVHGGEELAAVVHRHAVFNERAQLS